MEDLKFDPNEFVKNVSFTETPNYCIYGHSKSFKIALYDDNTIDPVKYWLHRPRKEVHDDCDVLKIRIFWTMMFEKNAVSVAEWGCMMTSGFDLTNLAVIEFLEDFLELFKSVADIPCFIRGFVSMENKITDKTFHLGDVLEWVKASGNTVMIHQLLLFGDKVLPLLEEVIGQYTFFLNRMAGNLSSMKKEEDQGLCTLCVKKSESSKTKGNKEFSKKNYQSAVKLYTKAIQYHPENHILYGNRALCYLQIAEYTLALADGKRAIILKQNWYKGHHRFCDALFLIGDFQRALASNEKALVLCKKDPEGIKELSQQNLRFREFIEKKKGEGLGDLDAHYMPFPFAFASNMEPGIPTPMYVSRIRLERDKTAPVPTGSAKKTEAKDSANIFDTENIKIPSELPSARKGVNTRTNSRSPHGKSRTKSKEPEKQRQPEVSKHDPPDIPKCNPGSTTSAINLSELQEKLKTLVETGHTALFDQCFHSAEQAFSQLLDLVDPAELKKLHLAMIDYVVLIYGHAKALLGIGQPEELTTAEQQFNKIIEKYTKQRFNCLAFYGIGNVHLRRNRFAEARNQFIKCQIMLNCKIVPGVLKWPTTSVIIEETRPEKLQMLLEKCIEECKFPPKPDAICHYPLCTGGNNKQIYFTDPDFEGFIRLFCCHLCKVEFHIDCWKNLKATKYFDKNDKDCLKDQCFTPDCEGNICRIVIYGSTGLVKWQGETKITEVKVSRKPIVKQKNSSPKKLKVKQERKLRRKLHEKVAKYSVKDRKESMTNEENSSKEVLLNDKSVKICGADPMLQLVKENAELIKMGVHNTSLLISNLFMWLVINQEEHMIYSTSITNSTQYEVMAMLINHLIKKSDKVKTRIFLHILSQLHEVDTKLHSWLKEINDLGLLAADVFLSHYLHHLLQLDLESLCSLWNETYGNRLNSLITCSELSEVVEYFDEQSPELKRCLIWFLEEYKERYQCPVLHQALDKYFNVIDHPCVAISKQENKVIHSIKVKNKTRKKKQKESKPLLLLPECGTAAQELDHICAENNALDSNEPVVVSKNICDQVAEFESRYEDISRSSFYLKIMDNKADLTRESLYEYFYQILDKHGPLELDSDLFVGEYNLFPPKAHKIVEEAGGLKPFLLGSLRFVMLSDNLIGTLKHNFFNTEATATFPRRFGLQVKNAKPVSSVQSMYNSNKNLLCDHLTINPGAKEFKPVFDGFHNSSNSQDSSNNSAPATQNDENVSSVNTLLSNSITNSQPVPFLFSAGKSASLVDETPLSSVPAKDHMQPVSFVNPPSKTVVQAFCSEKSETGSPECELKVACDTGSAPNSVSSSTVKVDKDSSDTQNPHQSLKAENLFLGSNSGTSINCVPCSDNVVKKMRPRKKTPLTRMVAVQVVIELSDHNVNTDPFYPFEKHQGDILRMEKEHQVLQEQLKEATEKYELSKSRNSDEVALGKEQLQKVIEENKISKTELDWFYQDLENEVKKWQQEKKEHQERLRVIKNNIKVLMENNESCLKSIEEKEQHYKRLLNEFLESSNKFENEKLKFEENIKKCKDSILESKKRASASEVTVLENQKNIEIFKLCCAMSSCEANLHFLHSVGTSASAPGHLGSQIISWNNYLSSIKNEIQNIQSQFEVRIDLVKSGAKLSSLQPVQVETFQSPPSIFIMQSNTLIDYPAVLTYSSASQLHNSLFPEYSSSVSLGSVPQEGGNTETSSNSTPLDHSSFEVLNVSGGCPPSKQATFNQSFQPDVNNPGLGGSSSISDVQPLASQVVNAGIAKKDQKNPYDKLIAQLNAIFPHYDGAELSSFVKATRAKNGNNFSGLEFCEVISRVTEFILDYQSKTSSHRETHITSDSLGQAGSERNEGTNCVNVNGAKGNPPSTMFVSQSTQPWKCVKETPKSSWGKSNESALPDDEPCIICHEELRQNIICVLECGHQFHKHCIKTWLNAQSTCPTCRVHVLLNEDFPVLRSRKRPT
ncbi:E3 ubiquitin-protein ligase TTC3-like [Pleurodeles waltl]|uniref:E3 ubiquitin-protein ligase TTC3-like n=1 Tax=Pleurodeles waltl TaxID=8319 RepID=UPI0037097F74